MQSLIAVIFKEDMDRAEAYRVELRGREERRRAGGLLQNGSRGLR